MRTANARQHIANADAALAEMRRIAEQAATQRQAILDDHTYDTGTRGREARDAALREAAADATQRIAQVAARASESLRYVADQELRPARAEWQTPSPAAQAAGERVRTLLASGMRLPDVLGALANDDDQPGLEYAHRSLAALARAGAGPRANAAVLERYIEGTNERLTDARWDGMMQAERDYHEIRRAVADRTEAVERERIYWTRTARGTRTTDDRFRHGFATDPQWRAMIDGAADGPVESAGTPEPVTA